MTDIKIDTAADLESFLKILAEESVASSRVKLAEDSTGDKEYQKGVVSRIKSDKSRFDEAEEEDLEDSDADAAVAGDSSESEADQGGDQPEADSAPEDSPKEEINYYSIRNIINQIRAGDSTRDSEVADPLEQYIMSDLSDEERELMHTFFLSVANIMNKTGKSPQDPSDPPTSINVAKSDSKEPTKDRSAQKLPKSSPEQKQTSRPSSVGPEDISPPIQVGSQMKEALRQKVLDLMRE